MPRATYVVCHVSI